MSGMGLEEGVGRGVGGLARAQFVLLPSSFWPTPCSPPL